MGTKRVSNSQDSLAGGIALLDIKTNYKVWYLLNYYIDKWNITRKFRESYIYMNSWFMEKMALQRSEENEVILVKGVGSIIASYGTTK